MSEPAGPAAVRRLVAAEVVFCGGGGLADTQLLRKAADMFDAAVGGSGALCDGERLRPEQLVGASGAFLGAACYVGFGVHGAPHHLAGIEDVEMVVSVNRDATAPLHDRAELAIIADAEAVLRALEAKPRPTPHIATSAPTTLLPRDRMERLLYPHVGRRARLEASDPETAASAIATLIERSRAGR